MKVSAAKESKQSSLQSRSRGEATGYSPPGFEAQDSQMGYALPVQAYGGEYEAQTDFPVQMIPYGTLEVGSYYRYVEHLEEYEPGQKGMIGKLVEAKSANKVKFHNGEVDSDQKVLEKIPDAKFDAKSPAAAGVPTLDFCACGAATLELRVEFNRRVLEDFILRHADDRTAPVRIISIGSGGLFQDFALLQALLKAGFANVTVDLVDTNFVSADRLQVLAKDLQGTPKKLQKLKTQMYGQMADFLAKTPVIDREKTKSPIKRATKVKSEVGVMARNINEMMFGGFYLARQKAFKAAIAELAGAANVQMNFHSGSDEVKFSGNKGDFATTMVMAVDVPGVVRTENDFLKKVVKQSGTVVARTLTNSIKKWDAK